MLAGGPGDSGIRVVTQMFAAGEGIRSVLKGDVIGIDQRGSGESKPSLAVAGRYGFSLTEPGDPATYLRLIKQSCALAAKRFSDEGVDLSGFTTLENADDVDALRAALGYNRINLWGTSYGSQLALAVLRRHEAHIDRVMLASPVGPDHLWKRPAHIQAALERFGRSEPDLLPLMERVLQDLKSHPVEVKLTHPIAKSEVTMVMGAFDVQLWTWYQLSQLETMKRLPEVYRAMANGDFTEPARWLAGFRAVAGIGSAMNHVMDAATGCSDRRRKQIEEEKTDFILGDIANFVDGYAKSAAWSVPRIDAEFFEPVRSSRPILVVCGEYDVKTPLENAHEILATLPQGRLLTVNDEGYGFRPRPDVLEVVKGFFDEVELPASAANGR